MRYVQTYTEVACKFCGSHTFEIDQATGIPGSCAACHKNYRPRNKEEQKLMEKAAARYLSKLEAKNNAVGVHVCEKCGSQLWSVFVNGDEAYIGHCKSCGNNYHGSQEQEVVEKTCKVTYDMTLGEYAEFKSTATKHRRITRESASENSASGAPIFDKETAAEKAAEAEAATNAKLQLPGETQEPEKRTEGEVDTKDTTPETVDPEAKTEDDHETETEVKKPAPKKKATRKKAKKKAAKKE